MDDLDDLWGVQDEREVVRQQSRLEEKLKLEKIRKAREDGSKTDTTLQNFRNLKVGFLYHSLKGVIRVKSICKDSWNRLACVEVLETGEVIEKFSTFKIYKEVKEQ